MEATVLNRFGFRQTDLIAESAIHESAPAYNFDDEDFAWKTKV
jgi:hypothetical protein